MLQRLRLFRAFSSGHGHGHHAVSKPIFAPSTQERIIYLNVYNDGEYERIPAYIGESVLEALKRFKMSSIEGSCEGGEKLDSMLEYPVQPNSFGLFCANCHIYVQSPWVEKLIPKHYIEEQQLDRAVTPSEKHSRLACTIKLEKWMDEMEISVPINEMDDE